MKDNKNECCGDKDPFVAITAIVGGISLVMVVLFLIFAKEQVGIMIPIVWAFVVLAFVACIFAYKTRKEYKKK